MMKALKLFTSILLAACLVLPLSKCAGPVEQSTGIEQPPIERYVVSAGSSIEDWFWLFSFLIPLISVAAFRKSSPSIKSEVSGLLSVVPVASYISVHVITGNLMVGGYIAVASVVTFFSTSLVGLVKVLKN